MLSRRDLERLAATLERRRFTERDIEHRSYVRPDGRNFAIVRARESGVEFTVASPGATFRPGTRSPTGSHTGRPGEFLLQTPAVGQGGAALFPPINGQATIPGPLEALAWETPEEITFTNTAVPIVVNGVGDGFEPGMLVQIVNQSPAEFYTVSGVSVTGPATITFTVTPDSIAAASGDLRLIRTGVGTLDVEEFVFSEVV